MKPSYPISRPSWIPTPQESDIPVSPPELTHETKFYRDTASAHLTPNQQLAEFLAECYADPLRYVLAVFPWQVKGTFLAEYHAPDVWQRGFLVELGQEIANRGFDGVNAVDPIQFSTASGHGIGKSAMCAWLVKFLLDTRPDCRITITAPTMPQLKARTWSQVGMWNGASLTSHWWRITSGQTMSMYHKDFPQTWRADAVPAVAEKSDAFAGQHNAHGSSAYIFDEASGIPEAIFGVRGGGLTDGEPFTFDFGNPIRFSGSFYNNMMGSQKHRYIRRFVDSRESAITNKRYLARLESDYGENSDYFRTRVRGLFPYASAQQLIPTGDVENCIYNTEIYTTAKDPIIMGVDVARYGDDDSVICIRHGQNNRDLTTISSLRGLPTTYLPYEWYNGIGLMELAGRVAHIASDIKPDAIFVDGGGVGGGVIDRLQQLGFDVIDVDGSKRPPNPVAYNNWRSNCYGALAAAIKLGLALPVPPDRSLTSARNTGDDDEWSEHIAERLKSELICVEYTYTKTDKIQLEDKDSIKSRLGRSPDVADALALTYALPILSVSNELPPTSHTAHHANDYDPTDRL